MTEKTRIFRLPHGEDLPWPAERPTTTIDLLAAVPSDEPMVIWPGEWQAIPTGLTLELPRDSVAQIWPISGQTLFFGISILNPVMRADYRGELQIILFNRGRRPHTVERGARIAQLCITPALPLDCE